MKLKKILVDGGPLFVKKTGIGHYVNNLLNELFEIDKKNRYFLYGYYFISKKFTEPFGGRFNNVKFRLIRFFPSKIDSLIARKIYPLPIDFMTRIRPNLVIFTNFVKNPTFYRTKSILVVYDLSFMIHSQFTKSKNSEYLNKNVPRSIKTTDLIVTISENSKNEIIENFKIDSSKIIIINPAVEGEDYYPRKKDEVKSVKSKFKITKEYILYTGTLEPRKNILGLLNAYSDLPKNIRDNFQLVLAGGKGWLDEEIEVKLNDLKDLSIIRTGYVEDQDLPALYSGATVFVYPSFYEGFGMPPLEAMACGTPVITSNNSSLPEVVGDAGIMVDAKDTRSLTKNIEKVLKSKKLQSEMSKKGLRQAKKFSWKKSAKKLYDLIQTID